jgi:hypothetical protein
MVDLQVPSDFPSGFSVVDARSDLSSDAVEGVVVERMRATRPTLPAALTSDTNFGNLGAALMPSSLVTRTVVAMSLMAIGLSLVSPSPRSESVSDDFPFLDQVLFKIRAMADRAPSP